MKFPDVIHSGKPEPDTEVPQAQTAHNNFWDFQFLHSEATHMFLWAMSDRGIPRSYRMMQGFGVNTYTLQNAKGERHFVKFHFTPTLGVHSFVWDEALKLAGQDPDFHREVLAIFCQDFAMKIRVPYLTPPDFNSLSFSLLDHVSAEFGCQDLIRMLIGTSRLFTTLLLLILKLIIPAAALYSAAPSSTPILKEQRCKELPLNIFDAPS